jgi:hypothetical protein
MSNFSIELAADNIVDNRTRQYFQEVLSSFVNGNYRSAVVMLWSVVVCDLVYKLQDLRDLYHDETAISILRDIEEKQASNSSSPEWEPFLLEQVNKRTYLLEISEYLHLQNVHKTRHLSAHPVLSASNLLFHPNKETTRALIRNALEAALLKPPIFSKKIVLEFIKDIAAKKSLLPDQAALKQYLDTKYFRGLHPTVEVELLKTVWKLCFRTENDDTNSNRDINSRVLILLYLRNPIQFREVIRSNSPYFSEVSASELPIKALLSFLAECSSIYDALNDAAKALISAYAKGSADAFAASLFLSDNFAQHIATLKQFEYEQLRDISEANWIKLVNFSREAGKIEDTFEIGISIYKNSGSYNGADVNFLRFVDPYITEYDVARLQLLLSGIESNRQTYDRGRSSIDHKKIAARIIDTGGINIDDYPKFKSSIE